jgi:hypothetical protein
MPQLDTATFLPQVFWLLLVFFIFYVLVINFILPKLSTILKVRSKKLSEGESILGDMTAETNEMGVVYDTILSKSLKESERLIQSSYSGALSWIEASSQNDISDLRKMNSYYLKSLGNIYAKRGILRGLTSSGKLPGLLRPFIRDRRRLRLPPRRFPSSQAGWRSVGAPS